MGAYNNDNFRKFSQKTSSAKLTSGLAPVSQTSLEPVVRRAIFVSAMRRASESADNVLTNHGLVCF